MAIVKFPRKEFEKVTGKIDEKMQEKIPLFGTPLESLNDEEIEIEIFPNRPDLYSLQGYLRSFLAFLGKKTGLKSYKVNKPEKNYEVRIDNSVKEVRPYTACAIVKSLSFNDEKIKVKGIGYHDHNWNYSLLTVMNYGIGWYWGKIRSEKFNIVWAKIVKSSNRYELIAVVNIDNNSFYNINPKNIVFKVDDFTGRYRKKIPTSISIEINDENIKADVKMKADKIHFGKALVAPYWRYHMKTDGFIYVNGEKENVEGICITEYLKFSF